MKINTTLNFELSSDQKSILNAHKSGSTIRTPGVETSYRPWNSSFVSCDTPVLQCEHSQNGKRS